MSGRMFITMSPERIGRSGNPDVALKSLEKIEELQSRFKDSEANRYWIGQIEIQKQVVKAWLLFARGEMESSLETMIKAAELEDKTEKNPVTPGSLLPAREMLGDLLMELNRPKDALVQYELSLKNCPNRFNTLYGAGRSAELIGDNKKAAFYFAEIEKINKSSGRTRDRLVHALNTTEKEI